MNYSIAELISNGLSVLIILVSFAVVILWYKPTVNIIKESLIGKYQPQGWFIIGVFFGFLGETLDNLYWIFPWSFKYLGLESTKYLMEFGVIPNIPFRQILGIFAAYCHLRSALSYTKHEDNIDKLHKFMFISALLGILYSLTLFLVR